MKNVAVVYGGFSSEYEISVASGTYVSSVIDTSKFNVFNVLITKEKWLAEGKYEINRHNFSFKNDKGDKVKFDIALILIHGDPGENGKLQSYFDLIGLPYVSCNSLAASLTFNKYYCNRYLHAQGIKIAKSIIIRPGQAVDTKQIIDYLKLPVFVKPDAGGSSFATFKVKSEQELLPAIEAAAKESEEVIVEEFIEGREITVGVIKTKGRIKALTPCEVRSKKEFFDYEAKYNPDLNEEIIPAPIENHLLNKAAELAKKIYKHLNCSGIVRVDFILSKNEFYFLELNSVPGMTSASIVPKMLRHDKIDITELYTELINQKLK